MFRPPIGKRNVAYSRANKIMHSETLTATSAKTNMCMQGECSAHYLPLAIQHYAVDTVQRAEIKVGTYGTNPLV